MKVTVLIRVPFLDKIPSLKTLVIYLARKGVRVNIISAKSENYPVSDFSEFPNIKMTLVNQRTKKFELPTSVKLLLAVLMDCLFSRADYYMGGDNTGSHLFAKIKRLLGIRYVNFLLEYPDVNNNAELNDIDNADLLITHDCWHGDFIMKYCRISKDRISFLPNTSYTEEYHHHDNYLAERLGIPAGKNIILHSGGLGKWFMCKELASVATKWNGDEALVFHTSHIVDSDEYYLNLRREIGNSDRVYFSTQPVPNTELDQLVASAKIGVATYSIKELGYRAENMGLAAGKIGNYLKCGVPVIATKVHSLSYLEEYHCGVLVDDILDIHAAIEKILSQYDDYVAGAYRCYEELWRPEKYLDAIFDKLLLK